MDKKALEAAQAAFLAKGGKVEEVETGKRSERSAADDLVRGCKCGCEGNYTDHSMRRGERGL